MGKINIVYTGAWVFVREWSGPSPLSQPFANCPGLAEKRFTTLSEFY